MFHNTKSIFTIYNNYFPCKFEADLIEKVKMVDIDDDMLKELKSADFEGFMKVGMKYADIVVKAEESYNEELSKLFEEFENKKEIDSIETKGEFSDRYYHLYNELVGVN